MTQGWIIPITPPCAWLAGAFRKLVHNLFRDRADCPPRPERVISTIYCGSSVAVIAAFHDMDATAENQTNAGFLGPKQNNLGSKRAGSAGKGEAYAYSV